MEAIAHNIRAYGQNCNGCVRLKKDIMIGTMTPEKEFVDIFLNNDQAEELARDLLRRVTENKNHDSII